MFETSRDRAWGTFISAFRRGARAARALILVGLGAGMVMGIFPRPAWSHSANEVWFEFRPDGRYRVYINYTIPALKELREVYIDFVSKKKAETFYWNLVRGGDFHLDDPDAMHFHEVKKSPTPW